MASFGTSGKGPLMDETKLVKYKTVMCQRMVRAGNCRYGHLCDFAHDSNELRRNLNQHWYQGVLCEIPDHDDKKCEFSHNDMELAYHPSIYKTKLCDKFPTSGGCPKGQYCANAHGKPDLRQKPPANQKSMMNGTVHQSPSPNTSPHSGRRIDTDSHRVAGQISKETVGPAPHRQQSYPNYSPGAMTPVEPPQEFQDTTNDLKIRILDLVDQISLLHTERTAYEQQQKSSQLVQDAYKSNREQIAQLRHQLENARLLIQAQEGKPNALARLSANALQQLQRKAAAASTAIAAFKPSASSPSHTLIKDLSELSLS